MKSNLIENRHIRIFISSTFQDLQDERDYLIKRVFPELRVLAAARDITLTELDLRWGITEEESKSGKVLEICLSEIEKSVPFFIGIIGNRYGWCPTSNELGISVLERYDSVKDYLNRHLSVTEMEMQFGVLERNEDMHAYFFISNNEVDEDSIDYPEKLKELKRRIKENSKPDGSKYPVFGYSTKEELGNQVKKSFISLMDELFPVKIMSSFDKEKLVHSAHKNQLCQNYVNNDEATNVLQHWLSDWNQNYLVITGNPGIGKSSLIANWINQIERLENGINIIYYFLGIGNGNNDYKNIQYYISKRICEIYGYNEDYEEINLRELFKKIQNEEKKLVLVIDGINRMYDEDNSKSLNWLPIAQGKIKILFTTLEQDKTNLLFKARNYRNYKLCPLVRNQRREVIYQYLKQYGKKLAEKQITSILDSKLCRNPFVLKTLLDELIYSAQFENLNQRINFFIDTNSTEEFLSRIIQDAEKEFGVEFVKGVLSLIYCSKNGLMESDINEILNISPLYLKQFFIPLNHSISDNAGRLVLENTTVRNIIYNRYLIDNEERNNYYKKILAHFKQKPDRDTKEIIPWLLYKLELHKELFEYISSIDNAIYLLNNDSHLFSTCWKYLINNDYSISCYLESQECTDIESFYKKTGIIIENDFHDVKTAKLFYDKIHDKLIERSISVNSTIHEMFKDIDSILEIKPYLINPNDLVNRAENMRISGQYHEALSMFIDALDIIEERNPNTIQHVEIYESIGKTYDDLGEFAKAIENYNNALEILKKIQYTETALEASVLCNLSISERTNGNISYAKELLEKSLSIMENYIGQDNHLMIQILMNLGALYNDKFDKPHKALSLYKKAFQIQIDLSENTNISKGNLYNNIAVSLNDFLAFDDKLEYFSSAYEVYVSLNADLELSFLLNALGTAYEHRHDYFHAFINYYHCLQLQINLLGDDHVTTISTQEDVKYTFNCLQQLNLMDEVMNEDFTLKDIDNEKDSEITALLYHKLVQMDDPQAKFVLSEITNEDSDMDEMSDDSYKLLLSAASSDFAEAQYKLGVYMYNMSKSTEDKNNSLSWLEKAAMQNFPDAIYMIGNIYLTDNEIDHSIEEAIAYLQKAAELYYTDAFNDLAWAYHISNDNINALKWAKLAVEEFPEDSNCRDTLAKIYIDLNNFHEAIEQLEKCVELQKAEGTNPQTLSKTINLINHVDNIIES